MNNTGRKKILILVEGAKKDVKVITRLFELYSELDVKYEIVPYCTNIYVLYQEFFEKDGGSDELDLLQVLKSKEKNLGKKKIFDERYTDIMLVFDLDPQDDKFTDEKIRKMEAYFCESSDMGKLYLNYPMIEAFYHMPNIPDPGYQSRTVSIDELIKGKYKERVQQETRGNDYNKFIKGRADANYVILENISKAYKLLGEEVEISGRWREVNLSAVLERQLEFLETGYLYVLCTCVMFIYDYNWGLLFRE